VLLWGEMRVGLLGDALQDEKRLRAVEPLAAPGQKHGSRLFATLPQPFIEHFPVLPLDGDELLHVAAFAEDMYQPSAVILGKIDTQQLGDAQACPQQGGNQGLVPQPLIRPPPHAHA
jgi:hypothetical protein